VSNKADYVNQSGDFRTGTLDFSRMTNEQLYLAIGLPMVFNSIVTVAVYVLLSARIGEGFAAVNQRFDDMRDLWRAELRRVEEVLDARLKHLEEHKP
jgi:hypothetical protein